MPNVDATPSDEDLGGGGSFPPSIIYLVGPPGVGKYTVAQAIAKLNHAVVVDNQLINIPIFSLLTEWPDTEVAKGMWREVESIRDAVFKMIEDIAPHSVSYVLTNALEEEPESHALFERVKRMALCRGSHFLAVVMTCDPQEQLRRIPDPSRTLRMKVDDVDRARRYIEATSFFVANNDEALAIDTTSLEPERAARRILAGLTRRVSASNDHEL